MALLLGIPTFLGGVQIPLGVELIPQLLAGLCALSFYAFTTVVILLHVVKNPEVTGDTLYGAIAVYLMIGLTWAVAYTVLERLQPGSFYIAATHNIDNLVNYSDFLYYSYVTLTTLGYGDITPVTSKARSLAFMEAVCGVLYLAVLVARLVGTYLAGAMGKN